MLRSLFGIFARSRLAARLLFGLDLPSLPRPCHYFDVTTVALARASIAATAAGAAVHPEAGRVAPRPPPCDQAPVMFVLAFANLVPVYAVADWPWETLGLQCVIFAFTLAAFDCLA